MADGNFHLELRLQSKPVHVDPSFFGDAGFWANNALYRNYSKAAEKSSNKDPKVAVLVVILDDSPVLLGVQMLVTSRHSRTRPSRQQILREWNSCFVM